MLQGDGKKGDSLVSTITVIACVAIVAIAAAMLVFAISGILANRDGGNVGADVRGSSSGSPSVSSIAEDDSAEASSSEEAEDNKLPGSVYRVNGTLGIDRPEAIPDMGEGGSSKGGSSGALSDAEAYSRLSEYLDAAGAYDGEVEVCAKELNDGYLLKSESSRRKRADAADDLESRILSDWEAVRNLGVPFWSKNIEAWDEICELYECLWHRIHVIGQAWGVSLSYKDPKGHEDEILEPIKADQVNGQNKYYSRFKELYPKVVLVKP